MSHRKASARSSNSIRRSSWSAVRNWIAKKGLPAVFSWTRSESGAASSRRQWSASLTNAARCSRGERAEHDVETRAPAFRTSSSVSMSGCDGVTSLSRYAPMTRRWRVSGWVNRSCEEPEAGRIGPLEIVEEERERVLLLGEHPDEVPEHDAEPVLRLGRRQLGDRRLPADDELDLRDHVDDELSVDPEGVEQPLPPGRDPLLALGEDLEHELPEGLDERGSKGCRACTDRTSPRGRRPAPGRSACRARGRARSCRSRSSRRRARAPASPWRPRARRPASKRGDLRLAPVELLRDLEAVGDVPLAQRERLDPPARAPLRRGTAPDRAGGRARSGSGPRASWRGASGRCARAASGTSGTSSDGDGGRAGDVAVDPLHADRAPRRGACPVSISIEGDAERVEIGAVVDRAVHPPRLLRRQVGQASPR